MNQDGQYFLAVQAKDPVYSFTFIIRNCNFIHCLTLQILRVKLL